MEINLNTDRRTFFRQYVELLQEFPPINKLCNRERQLLAEYLYFNDKYKDIEEKQRFKLIFDYDTRIDIMENTGMNENMYWNNLSRLRKEGIVKGRTLNANLLVYPEQETELIFRFNING